MAELTHPIEPGNVYEDHSDRDIGLVTIESMYVAVDGTVEVTVEEAVSVDGLLTGTHKTRVVTSEYIKDRILSGELVLRAS